MRLARRSVALVCAFVGLSMLAACGGGGGGGGGSPSAPSVASIVISPAPVTMGTDTTQQFAATARDQSGTTMNGVTFTWSSSNSAAATISNNGMASAIAAGTTNISASAQGVSSASVAVTVVQSTSVSGTAATGAPIANAVVTLKDRQGTTRTATTDAAGRFSMDTTGLATPFVLRVQPPTGLALYSVSADARVSGVINITPLTDLIVRSWYGVQNVAVDAAFAALASNAPPSPGSVEVISKVVASMVHNWLVRGGVDASSFNLISSPFDANSTGFDGVLDRVTVDTSTRTVTITDGSTTQTSTLSYSTNPPSVIVQTDVSSPTGTSNTRVSTSVPFGAAEQSYVEGVNTALAALANAANAGGGNLSAGDLTPFFSADFWDGGLPTSYVAESPSRLKRRSIVAVTTPLLASKESMLRMVADLIGRQVSFRVLGSCEPSVIIEARVKGCVEVLRISYGSKNNESGRYS